MDTLPTFQSKITRALFAISSIFLVLMLLILLSARSFLVGSLTEEYLQSLGRFVNEDIRYVLLVRDPVTTRTYLEGLTRFPWIHSVQLFDTDGVLIEEIGQSNWNPSIAQYTFDGAVQAVESQVHLMRSIELEEDLKTRSVGAFLHLSILDDAFQSIIERVIYLLITGSGIVSLGLFLMSAYFARRASQVVTEFATDIQSIDPERGDLALIDREINIREFAVVQNSFNALVNRVEQHNVELERRIASRTRDLMNALKDKEISEGVRSSLVMNLSHDLKTPLTASSGYLDHALEEVDSPHPDLFVVRHAIARARDSGRSLAEEVNTLLQYAISADDLSQIAHKPVNIEALIQTAIDASSSIREKAGNTIEFAYSGPNNIVTAGRLIRHIVDNLLSNANRYCAHGHITVTADGSSGLTLVVSDTGSGIPADERERIFEPHFRSAVNDAMGPKGMGIGLALTKTWVDHLGGSITLDPSASVTQFRVNIPGRSS